MHDRPICLTAFLFVAFALCSFAGCGQRELTPPMGPTPRVMSTPLEVASATGASIKGGRITLFDKIPSQPAGADAITIEAENYDDIFWQSADTTTMVSERWIEEVEARGANVSFPDDAASGGAYLERVTTAAYPFYVTEPGEYAVWMRLWRPSRGNWVFDWQVGDREPTRIRLESEEYKTWYWQKAGTVTLDRGNQTFVFQNLHSGKRIDKIVLHRKAGFAPEGNGPEATPMRAMDEGVVQFKPLTPAGVRKWRRIVLDRLNDVGSVTMEYSMDGRQWHTLGPKGHLALGLAHQSPTLHSRLHLASAGGQPPVLRLPRAVFEPSVGAYPMLWASNDDDAIHYTFHGETGAIAGIEIHRQRSTESQPNDRIAILPTGLTTEPLRVFTQKPGDPLPPGQWHGFDAFNLVKTEQEGHRQIAFTYRGKILPIEIVVTYATNPKGYLDVDVTVANNTDTEILKIECPRLTGVRIGDDSDDDTLLWPVGTGKKYVRPTSQGPLTMGYPKAAVGYFDLYDETAGFYMGTHDPKLISTVMAARPDSSRTWMTFTWTRQDRIRPGETQSFPMALGAHRTDWHRAAHWYRDFYAKAFPPADWPEWLDESDGWLFHNISFTSPRFDRLNEFVFRQAIRLGFRHVQMWGTTTSGSCPSYYYPPERCGGPDAFAEGNTWWKDRGGVVGYYFHANGINPWCSWPENLSYFGVKWENLPAYARPPMWKKDSDASWQWILRNAHYGPDRNPPEPDIERWKLFSERTRGTPRENAPAHDYAYMSTFSEPWRDWLTFWVIDKYVGDYGCGAAYLDTLHYGAESPEYNPYMNMHGEGNGGQYRQQLAKRIRDEGRAINPMWMPVQEMQCDAYGMYVGYMIGASAIDTEMLRYTHPDHVCFEGQTGSGWGGKRFKRYNSAWLYGNRLDHRLYEAWAVETVRMRQWLTRWLNASRFVDDLGLVIDNPDVRGKLHRLTDDGARGFVATFHHTARMDNYPQNATLRGKTFEPTAVTIDLGPMAEVDGLDREGLTAQSFVPHRAILLDLGRDPREIPFEIVRGDGSPKVRFELPPRQLSAVLFPSRATGPQSFLAQVDQKDFKQLDVKIFNPTDGTLTGTVTAAPETFELIETGKPFEVAPGKLTVVSFHYPDNTPPPITDLVRVTIDAGGAARTIRAGAYPFLDDASFESNRLHTYADTGADGERSRVLQGREFLFANMEGDRSYRLSFEVRGKDGGGEATFGMNDRYTRMASDRITDDTSQSGRMLRFEEPFAFKKDRWQTVTVTLHTPAMYHDALLEFNTGEAEMLIDDVRLEELPKGAEVEHRPRMVE